MVFENQLDLIAENAILNSQHKGTGLKYRIDSAIGAENDITKRHYKQNSQGCRCTGYKQSDAVQ